MCVAFRVGFLTIKERTDLAHIGCHKATPVPRGVSTFTSPTPPGRRGVALPSEALDRETGRYKSHLVVLDDNGGAAPDGLSGVLYRVEILLGVSMDARISVDGQAREVKDICPGDLVALVDQTEKTIPKEEAVD